MSNVRTLKTIPQARNAESIAKLRELLERAERGEIIGFTGCFYLPGNEYTVVGTRCESIHSEAGVLLECAIERLKPDSSVGE